MQEQLTLLQSIVRWMKRIFSLQVIGTLVSLVGLYFAAQQFTREKGGHLTATYDSQPVANGSTKELFVCTQQPGTDVGTLLPELRFANPTAYSIRDFALQYDIEAQGVRFRSTDFYKALASQSQTSLRYYENTLYAYSSIEPPFVSLLAETPDNECRLRIRATYDGAKKPFEHRMNIRIRQIDRKAGSSFQEWRAACDALIARTEQTPVCDILYVGSDNRAYAADVRPQTRATTTTPTEAAPNPTTDATTAKPAAVAPPKATATTPKAPATASTADQAAASPKAPAVSESSESRKTSKTPEAPTTSNTGPAAVRSTTTSTGISVSALMNEVRARVLRADTIRRNGNLGLRLTFEKPSAACEVFAVSKVTEGNGREWLSGDRFEITPSTASHTIVFGSETTNAVFQQLAHEDSTLCRYVRQNERDPFLFTNDAPVPVGIAFECSDGQKRMSLELVLEANQTRGYRLDSIYRMTAPVRYFKLQEVPLRTWSLEHIFYDENNALDWEQIGLAVFTLFLLLLPFAFWGLSDWSIRKMLQEDGLWGTLRMLIVSPIVGIVILIMLYYNGYNY